MNSEILFKLYYLIWNEQNNIEVSYKNNSKDKKEIHNLKKMNLNLEDIKNYTKDVKEISSIKKYFKDTLFLDIWIELCNLDIKFFKEESISIINNHICDIVNALHYISGTTLDEYLEYNDEDFIPIYSEEDFSVKAYEVGESLKIKNCLLILRKLDLVLYNSIEMKVQRELTKKLKNMEFVKKLWNTIDVKEDGKVSLNKSSLMSLKLLFKKYPNAKEECFEEVNNYYNYLKLSKEKQIKLVEELIFG